MTTFELDVRAPILGRIWFPDEPRVRLMPQEETLMAILEENCVYEASKQAAYSTLRAATAGKRVLFVIHGYNSGDKAVRPSYGTLHVKAQEIVSPRTSLSIIGGHYDCVVYVYWPGGTKLFYHLARMRTSPVGEKLRKMIIAIQRDVDCIDIQTHSMGARVALETLKNADLRVRNLIMAAAAVQDDECTIGGKYAAAINSLDGRALVPWSKGDGVLKKGFFAGEMDRALGYCGPQAGLECPEKLVCRDATAWGDGHGVFREQELYYEMWLAFLEGAI